MRPRQRPLRRRRATALNTRKGLGILQRSGGRGDPSAAGRGKFLLTACVNKTRRAPTAVRRGAILERSVREESRPFETRLMGAGREGKIPVERLDQGVSVA
jgi:hypothetical protein